MYRAMPTMSLSDLRKQQATIVASLDEAPVMLTQNGKGAGILVAPATWNAIMDLLEDQEDLIVALKVELDIALGNTKVETIDDADAFMTEIMDEDVSIPA